MRLESDFRCRKQVLLELELLVVFLSTLCLFHNCHNYIYSLAKDSSFFLQLGVSVVISFSVDNDLSVHILCSYIYWFIHLDTTKTETV